MSTLIKNTGYLSNGKIKSPMFTLSNGNALTLVLDSNYASSPAGQGDQTGVDKLYVYESADRVTWTLRATIPRATGNAAYTAALFPDNSLAIFGVESGAGTAKAYYAKLTYAGYGVSAWQTLTGDATNLPTYIEVRRMAATVTDTGVPIFMVKTATNAAPNTTKTEIYCRRTSDSTWVRSCQISEATNVYAQNIDMVALGGTATARVLIAAQHFTIADGTDFGTSQGVNIEGWTINESTGVMAGSGATAYNNLVTGLDPNFQFAGLVPSNLRIWHSNSTSEFTLAIWNQGISIRIYRGTFDGTTFNTLTNASDTVYLDYASLGGSFYATSGDFSFGKNASGTVDYILANAYYGNGVDTDGRRTTIPIKVYRSDNSVFFADKSITNYNTRFNAGDAYPANYNNAHISGNDRNFSLNVHDWMIQESKNDGVGFSQYSKHQYFGWVQLPAPIGVKPTNSSTEVTGNPTTSATFTLAGSPKFYPSPYIVHWQFAKDTGFTTSVVDFYQANGKFSPAIQLGGSTLVKNDQLPIGTLTLSQGTWYARARGVTVFDAYTSWSATNTFTVAHAPSSVPLAPSGGGFGVYGTGTKQFTWNFVDSADADYQTAYEVIIERDDTGAVVIDTGKIASLSPAANIAIGSAFKDIVLRWRVRTWDRDDVAGAYSGNSLFALSDPPGISSVTPANAATVTSGVPTASFVVSATGGRTIKSYTVTWTQAGNTIYTTGLVSGTITTGSTVNAVGDKSYLKNNQSYSMSITVTDSVGLSNTFGPNVFSTAWVLPSAPSTVTVAVANYNVDGAGYNTVSWADTGRDANFSKWVVYRRDSQLDPGSGAVVSVGTYQPVGEIYAANTTGYTLRDYLAPSNCKVEYAVTQVVLRFGDTVESSQSAASTSPSIVSDGYWLIKPSSGGSVAVVVRLSNVTEDSFTEEYEESEYTVIGRGRHFDIGEDLGSAGSLTAKIRTNNGGQTARQKKISLEAIRDLKQMLYLRNPFGDILKVHVGSLGVTRISGVGTQEFCDITIPYSEVNQ